MFFRGPPRFALLGAVEDKLEENVRKRMESINSEAYWFPDTVLVVTGPLSVSLTDPFSVVLELTGC